MSAQPSKNSLNIHLKSDSLGDPRSGKENMLTPFSLLFCLSQWRTAALLKGGHSCPRRAQQRTNPGINTRGLLGSAGRHFGSMPPPSHPMGLVGQSLPSLQHSSAPPQSAPASSFAIQIWFEHLLCFCAPPVTMLLLVSVSSAIYFYPSEHVYTGVRSLSFLVWSLLSVFP